TTQAFARGHGTCTCLRSSAKAAGPRLHLAHPWTTNPIPRIIRIGMGTHRRHRSPCRHSSTCIPPKEAAVAERRGEEVTDRTRDLLDMRFQGEMAGVEEANDCIGHVPRERLGTGRQEERIVLAPNREEGWLVRAEIVLEGRI